jgi:hypothetical protein
MKLTEYKGFEVHIPTSGGKAGKGCNKTSTIQLRRKSSIAKQFSFVVADSASRTEAVAKARKWADEQPS